MAKAVKKAGRPEKKEEPVKVKGEFLEVFKVVKQNKEQTLSKKKKS